MHSFGSDGVQSWLGVKIAEAGAIAAPTVGPVIISVGGFNIPLVAMGLSLAGLLLARFIAPPPLRRLNKRQRYALTALLVIVLFLIVTGQFGDGKPLGAGMAVAWGIGLGFSGLMVLELFGPRVIEALKILLGGTLGGK